MLLDNEEEEEEETTTDPLPIFNPLLDLGGKPRFLKYKKEKTSSNSFHIQTPWLQEHKDFDDEDDSLLSDTKENNTEEEESTTDDNEEEEEEEPEPVSST